MNQDESSIAFIPLVAKPVARTSIKGLTHERFQDQLLNGYLDFTLANHGYLLVATGRDAEGYPLPRNAPKTFQTRDGRPVIPGSTLKGCFRALFEAATHSCLRVMSREYRGGGSVLSRPDQYEPLKTDKSLLACRDLARLCPACRIFGTLCEPDPWQGRVRMGDAVLLDEKPRFAANLAMPKQEAPRPKARPGSTRFTDYYPKGRMAGRKFYRRSLQPGRVAQLQKGGGYGPAPASPLLSGHRFRFRLDYRNLTEAELGALLAVLLLPGQCRHALGSAKNHGWGSCRLELAHWHEIDSQNRYRGLPERFDPTTQHQRLAALERQAQTLLVKESLEQIYTLLTPT